MCKKLERVVMCDNGAGEKFIKVIDGNFPAKIESCDE
jgi:hypothetical protein